MSGPQRYPPNHQPSFGSAPGTPLSPSANPGAPPSFRTNVNRTKTKRWVEAKTFSYDGDEWGDDDEEEEYEEEQPPQQPPIPGHYAQAPTYPPGGPVGPAHGGGPPQPLQTQFPQGRGYDNGARSASGFVPGPAAIAAPRKDRAVSADASSTRPAQSAGPNTSETAPRTTSPPQPFIRPADIYKRLQEERERERKSQESSRSDAGSTASAPRQTTETTTKTAPPIVNSPSTPSQPRSNLALPELKRLSGFGADFMADSEESGAAPAATAPVPSQPQPTLNHNASQGFRSAVNQAFDVPQTPVSSSDSVVRSNSDSTSAISPIIGGREEFEKTPTITEEPGESTPANGSSPIELKPGHRRDLSIPSPGNSPARQPLLADSEEFPHSENVTPSHSLGDDVSGDVNPEQNSHEAFMPSATHGSQGLEDMPTSQQPGDLEAKEHPATSSVVAPAETSNIPEISHEPPTPLQIPKEEEPTPTPPAIVETAPSMSVETSPQDYESDRLRKEIIRSLSPEEVKEKGPFAAAPPPPDEKPISSVRPGHESTYLPREYDSYWEEHPEMAATEPLQPKAPTSVDQDVQPQPADELASMPVTDALPASGPSAKPRLKKKFSWEESDSEPEVVLEEKSTPTTHAPSVPVPAPIDQPSGIDKSEEVGIPTLVVDPPANLQQVDSHSPVEGLMVAENTTFSPEKESFTANRETRPELIASKEDDDSEFSSLQQPQSIQAPPAAPIPSSAPVPQPVQAHPTTQPAAPDLKLVTFREILDMDAPLERIRMFKQTRELFARMDEGLLTNWISQMSETLPEHSDLVNRNGQLPPGFQPQITSRGKLSKLLPTSTSSQDVSQSTFTPSHARKTSGSPLGGINRQSVESRSKDLLHSAGVLGGKAAGGAKGLFSKGKNKFRGGGTDKGSIASSPKRSRRRSLQMPWSSPDPEHEVASSDPEPPAPLQRGKKDPSKRLSDQPTRMPPRLPSLKFPEHPLRFNIADETRHSIATITPDVDPFFSDRTSSASQLPPFTQPLSSANVQNRSEQTQPDPWNRTSVIPAPGELKTMHPINTSVSRTSTGNTSITRRMMDDDSMSPSTAGVWDDDEDYRNYYRGTFGDGGQVVPSLGNFLPMADLYSAESNASAQDLAARDETEKDGTAAADSQADRKLSSHLERAGERETTISAADDAETVTLSDKPDSGPTWSQDVSSMDGTFSGETVQRILFSKEDYKGEVAAKAVQEDSEDEDVYSEDITPPATIPDNVHEAVFERSKREIGDFNKDAENATAETFLHSTGKAVPAASTMERDNHYLPSKGGEEGAGTPGLELKKDVPVAPPQRHLGEVVTSEPKDSGELREPAAKDPLPSAEEWAPETVSAPKPEGDVILNEEHGALTEHEVSPLASSPAPSTKDNVQPAQNKYVEDRSGADEEPEELPPKLPVKDVSTESGLSGLGLTESIPLVLATNEDGVVSPARQGKIGSQGTSTGPLPATAGTPEISLATYEENDDVYPDSTETIEKRKVTSPAEPVKVLGTGLTDSPILKSDYKALTDSEAASGVDAYVGISRGSSLQNVLAREDVEPKDQPVKTSLDRPIKDDKTLDAQTNEASLSTPASAREATALPDSSNVQHAAPETDPSTTDGEDDSRNPSEPVGQTTSNIAEEQEDPTFAGQQNGPSPIPEREQPPQPSDNDSRRSSVSDLEKDIEKAQLLRTEYSHDGRASAAGSYEITQNTGGHNRTDSLPPFTEFADGGGVGHDSHPDEPPPPFPEPDAPYLPDQKPGEVETSPPYTSPPVTPKREPVKDSTRMNFPSPPRSIPTAQSVQGNGEIRLSARPPPPHLPLDASWDPHRRNHHSPASSVSSVGPVPSVGVVDLRNRALQNVGNTPSPMGSPNRNEQLEEAARAAAAAHHFNYASRYGQAIDRTPFAPESRGTIAQRAQTFNSSSSPTRRGSRHPGQSSVNRGNLFDGPGSTEQQRVRTDIGGIASVYDPRGALPPLNYPLTDPAATLQKDEGKKAKKKEKRQSASSAEATADSQKKKGFRLTSLFGRSKTESDRSPPSSQGVTAPQPQSGQSVQDNNIPLPHHSRTFSGTPPPPNGYYGPPTSTSQEQPISYPVQKAPVGGGIFKGRFYGKSHSTAPAAPQQQPPPLASSINQQERYRINSGDYATFSPSHLSSVSSSGTPESSNVPKSRPYPMTRAARERWSASSATSGSNEAGPDGRGRSRAMDLHMRSRSPRSRPVRADEHRQPSTNQYDPAYGLGRFHAVPETVRNGDQERPWSLSLPDDPEERRRTIQAHRDSLAGHRHDHAQSGRKLADVAEHESVTATPPRLTLLTPQRSVSPVGYSRVEGNGRLDDVEPTLVNPRHLQEQVRLYQQEHGQGQGQDIAHRRKPSNLSIPMKEADLSFMPASPPDPQQHPALRQQQDEVQEGEDPGTNSGTHSTKDAYLDRNVIQKTVQPVELPVRNEDDDEIVMSSTAYPGQEWHPEGFSHWMPY